MIDERKLERRFESLAGSAERGTFFRSIDVQWFLEGTPLSAIGSRRCGGRYNRKATFEALYVSDTPVTALYETEAIYEGVDGIVGARQPPRLMMSLDVILDDVLDLREPAVLDALGVTLDDLKRPWKLAQAESRPVLTQRVGTAARAAEIEALLAPSARVESGVNLIVFPDRLRTISRVQLVVGAMASVASHTLVGKYIPVRRASR